MPAVVRGSARQAMPAKLRVVTTVAPLTDMVGQVGQDAIDLHGLVPAGGQLAYLSACSK